MEIGNPIKKHIIKPLSIPIPQKEKPVGEPVKPVQQPTEQPTVLQPART